MYPSPSNLLLHRSLPRPDGTHETRNSPSRFPLRRCTRVEGTVWRLRHKPSCLAPPMTAQCAYRPKVLTLYRPSTCRRRPYPPVAAKRPRVRARRSLAAGTLCRKPRLRSSRHHQRRPRRRPAQTRTRASHGMRPHRAARRALRSTSSPIGRREGRRAPSRCRRRSQRARTARRPPRVGRA